ncbi:hypothetical protein Bca52824_045345 [Brassica carinata]|uniref:Uncharacterized protein n=1 Tax=Brassica carinata TaxID=52824 RepID=A0A8X7URG1_BRACI|nr:hypothetical protein Bca52824_045345 [Brassica carinata]
MEAETDATKGQESKQQMRDEELFKAAESGDSSVFMSLSPQQLAKSLSFRNEDVSEIVKLLSSVDESKTVFNSKYDEGWAPLHSAASIGKAGLVEILLTRGFVPTELKKAIMQTRGEKKLIHSQLAQLINEKPQVIQEYESRKARMVRPVRTLFLLSPLVSSK